MDKIEIIQSGDVYSCDIGFFQATNEKQAQQIKEL